MSSFQGVRQFFAVGLVLLALAPGLFAQAPAVPGNPLPTPTAAIQSLPEAPLPQTAEALAAEPGFPPAANGGQSAAEPAASVSASGGSSSSQAGAQPSQRDKAEQQIKEQEKQRIGGIVPAFNVSYRADAVSMTPGQKIRLAFRSATDPATFAISFLAAGYGELNDDAGFGWGPEGYFERSGAAYLDAFDGSMIGNGILPALLHQDPRYFRLGHGAVGHRILYALASNVMCRHDNTHKWEANYSNVGGNILSGAISNLYYPSGDSGVELMFTNGLVVTAEGGMGSLFQEFWPDFARKFLHQDPTHGLDAQARAADKAEKARKHNPTLDK